MMSHRWMLCWALTPLVGLPAFSQSVISAHSGLIHFLDGTVFLDDQRIEQKTGKFPQMNNGSELRTDDGRAEVLLTPGAFLRMGENSAIRMVSNQLENTRVELLKGSAVLDQGTVALSNTAITVLYNLDQVRIQKAGRYRFDSDPPQLKVEAGEAEVTSGEKSVKVREGYAVPFDGALAARKLSGDSSGDSTDGLDAWNHERDTTVAENNLDAAATSDLSGVIDGWENDPDAVLGSLGLPPYVPGMSTLPGTSVYAPSYGYGSSLDGFSPYGAGIGTMAPYSVWGAIPVTPLVIYPRPLYRSYRSPYSVYGSSIYRSPSYPGRTGIIGGGSAYRGYAPFHTMTPIRPGIGVGVGIGMGRPAIGVGRPAMGMGHVGGHR
jgi:hypothetical protein